MKKEKLILKWKVVIIMKYLKKRFIFEKDSQKNENGFFTSEHFLESPGKAERLSLRIGLNKFSEGITLSYAET